ncbi:MAG: sodium/solute symporter [Syntrophobacterales bacterium]|jgi:SSS family transporter|nr:sodium/solute symporter [Syntrophobacterales bacterium]
MEISTFLPRGSSLTWQDYSVLLALLVVMVFIGLYCGRKEESTADFFLGKRQIPWWAACLSFVATEISAVTLISVPAIAYMENWEYAQFFIGSFLARVVIAFLFIPAFYRYNCTSIYEFLKYRFGPETQIAGSILFFITRLLASGVRLMVACLAVSVLIGWPIIPTILLFSVICILYIAWGGIKAVVWTNVVQALVFTLAGVAAIGFLLTQIDGGAAAVVAIAGQAGKLKIFNWGPGLMEAGAPVFLKSLLTDPNLLVLATLNGFFGSMAAFGTDQETMQRLLTVETRRESQKTMLMTPIGSFLVMLIFLSVGACLYVFYAQHPGLPLPAKLDKIFPYFIEQTMPPMMRGLMLAAIVLASIDSPLGSLTSSFVTDIYRPVLFKSATERHYLFVSRICVVIFGIILGVIAFIFSHFEKFLWLAFKIGGVTYGSLLGVFLLGLLTTRRCNRVNVVAMTLAALAMLVLLILSEKDIFPLGWTWLLLIGTFLTFAIGWIFGTKAEEAAASR